MILSEDQKDFSRVYFLQNHSLNYAEFFFNMGAAGVADSRGLYFSFEGVRIIETTVDFFDLLREISSPEEVYKKEDGGKIY